MVKKLVEILTNLGYLWNTDGSFSKKISKNVEILFEVGVGACIYHNLNTKYLFTKKDFDRFIKINNEIKKAGKILEKEKSILDKIEKELEIIIKGSTHLWVISEIRKCVDN